MRRLLFILISLFTYTVYASYAEEKIEFNAIAPEVVKVGQQFQVKFEINTMQATNFRGPSFSGFEVLNGPAESMGQSIQITNGHRTQIVSNARVYYLMATQEGTYTVDAATFQVGDKQYSTQPITIKVLSGEDADERIATQSARKSTAGGNDLFAQIILSKRKVYEQEAILATIKLFAGQSVNLSQVLSANFPSFDGFAVSEMELGDDRQLKLEEVNGKIYRTVELAQYLLFPQKTGKIDISSGKMEVLTQVPRQVSIHDLFNMDMYDDVRREVNIPATSVTVEPLPSGRPASFMNAIGNFTITSSINNTQVKENEAITIKLEIKGTGNLKYIKNPEMNFPEDFETYDPVVNVETKNTTSGLQGSKTIEYTAIPRFAGDFTIPAISFSYFDTSTNSYKTLTTQSFELKVEKGDGKSSATVMSNFTNKENVKLLGQDIRFIKVGDTKLQREITFIFGSWGYILGYIVPALMFIIFVIVYRKQAKANANIALMKTKKANKVAKKRLKLAGNYLKEHQKEQFYDEMLKAVWGYLSDKLSLPLSELTKDNVEAELNKYGADRALITRFMEILDTCEFAQYAPAQSEKAMDDLYESTVEAIGKMENTIKK